MVDQQNKSRYQRAGLCGIVLNVRYALALTILISPLLTFANELENCLYVQLEWSDALLTSFHEKCIAEYERCMDEQESDAKSIDTKGKRDCEQMPLPLDERYFGMCPLTMVKLESEHSTGSDSLLTRSYNRDDFRMRGPYEFGNTYKFKETKAELENALKKDPNNISFLLALTNHLDEDTETLRILENEIRFRELDPNCILDIPYSGTSISHHLNTLFSTRENGIQPNSSLSDEVINDIVTRSWEALMKMYKRGFDTTITNKKLRIAIQWLYASPLDAHSEYMSEISKILSLTQQNHLKSTRKYIANHMRSEFGIDSRHGRSHSLALACNDLAYEAGLVNLCINLIEQYSQVDHAGKQPLSTDLFQAMLSLLTSSSRICDEEFLMVLHVLEGLHYSKTCLTEMRTKIVEKIRLVINRFVSFSGSYQIHLLNAYLTLDDSTPSHFEKAIQRDDQIILHTLTIAKRLEYFDKHEAAMEIIDLGIAFARERDFNTTIKENRWAKYFGFPAIDSRQIVIGLNLALVTLIDAKSQLSHGMDVSFSENPYFDWSYENIEATSF